MKMAEPFEKRLCDLVRNLKHLYGVTQPWHRNTHYRTAVEQWTGEFDGGKGSARHKLLTLSCPLVDVMLNIHASVKDVGVCGQSLLCCEQN